MSSHEGQARPGGRAWGVRTAVALGFGLALGLGCAHDSSGAPSRDIASVSRLSDSITQQRQGNELVTQYDLNHDGKPDVWEYSVPAQGPDGKEQPRLARQELDLNFDGKVDLVRFYDDQEQVVKELYDLDFDGKIDQINDYEHNRLVRKERFLGASGKPDEWVYYERGHIVRKERDTTGSGRVNYWEYWENDKVDRIGEDLDGDGKIDRWIKPPAAGAGS